MGNVLLVPLKCQPLTNLSPGVSCPGHRCDPAAPSASLCRDQGVIPSLTGISPRCTTVSQEMLSGAALLSLLHMEH